jgi:hypothetical protein
MSDVLVFRGNEEASCWWVEAMDYDGRTLFAGQAAERRAQEYAEWLESRVVKPGAVEALPGAANVGLA